MKYIFTITVFFLSAHLSLAKEFVLTVDDPDGIALSRYIEYYEDKNKSLSVDDFMKMEELPSIDGYLETKSNYWFRITIINL